MYLNTFELAVQKLVDVSKSRFVSMECLLIRRAIYGHSFALSGLFLVSNDRATVFYQKFAKSFEVAQYPGGTDSLRIIYQLTPLNRFNNSACIPVESMSEFYRRRTLEDVFKMFPTAPPIVLEWLFSDLYIQVMGV